MQKMVAAAGEHAGQAQAPAIAGQGGRPGFQHRAIGQFQFDAIAAEGLVRREFHHCFSVNARHHRRWRGW